ncbi:hypothetical protein HDZ31DRAFT_33500 [Schizophyllum fasciatum]
MLATTAAALLATAALARGAGLKSAATSPYGQSAANLTLHQINMYGFALSAAAPAALSISAALDGDRLTTRCPTPGLEAVLVPVALSNDSAYTDEYTVEFVSARDGLPANTVFGGWSLSEDRVGLADPAFTKVVNKVGGRCGVGGYEIDRTGRFGEGVFALTWVNGSYDDHGAYQGRYIVLDSANDVSC